MLYIKGLLKSFEEKKEEKEKEKPLKHKTNKPSNCRWGAGLRHSLSPSWARTQNSPTSASHTLILQACATMFGLKKTFLKVDDKSLSFGD